MEASGMSWNCPLCKKMNDGSISICECGYNYINNKSDSRKEDKIIEIEKDHSKDEGLANTQNIRKKDLRFVRTPAVFLMGGAIFLLVYTVLTCLNGLKTTVTQFDFWFLILISFGCGITGHYLWKGARKAVPWARILFVLQIPIIFSNHIIFNFFTGIGLDITWTKEWTGISPCYGAEFQFFVNATGIETVLGLNVGAAICLAMLFRFKLCPKMTMKQLLYRSFSIRGRASRNEWWLWLIGFILGPIFTIILFGTIYIQISKGMGQFPLPEFSLSFFEGGLKGYFNITIRHMHTITALFFLSVLIFGWLLVAASTRRLHDQDRKGWYALIGLIPYVQITIVGLLGFYREVPKNGGPNRFG
jgi:uncharacterized membrane protein YhaH (DUF805 family)